MISVFERSALGLDEACSDSPEMDLTENSTKALFCLCGNGRAGDGSSTEGGTSVLSSKTTSLRATRGGVSPVLPYLLDVRAIGGKCPSAVFCRPSIEDNRRGVSLCSSIGRS